MNVFYSDGGHGWLEVKREELKDLGVYNKISKFSYERGAYVYLEEDCDAYEYLAAFKQRYGYEPDYTEQIVNGDSVIRTYDRFTK